MVGEAEGERTLIAARRGCKGVVQSRSRTEPVENDLYLKSKRKVSIIGANWLARVGWKR